MSLAIYAAKPKDKPYKPGDGGGLYLEVQQQFRIGGSPPLNRGIHRTRSR